jgi:hypothetical protein
MSDNKFNEIEMADDKNTARHLDHRDEGTRVGNIAITPHMTAEEKQAAIKLANEADPGPSITSWRYFKFLITAFLVILNSGDNGTPLSIHSARRFPQQRADELIVGFDGTVMSSVNSMEQFQTYFGLPGPLAGGTSLVFVGHHPVSHMITALSEQHAENFQLLALKIGHSPGRD